ncbi:MAG: Crp/Fnr family transcriptional regulator [Elusimicrobia bacterium]|nr:Crp/Fnr family transcriptional regulator [Elusimicrobiota bacterium]
MDRCKADNLYHKGQLVFQEGTPALGVHCVYEGQLKLYKSGAHGRPQIIGLANPGSMVGHRAVLTDKAHTFTAESLGEARVCFVNRSTFRSLVANNPSIADSLLKKLAQDLDEAEDRLIEVVEQPVPVRLARLLMSLKEGYGRSTPQGLRISISLTREEMAEMIGTTQETTIRLLSQFRKKGLIRLDDKSITLLDIPRLTQIVNVPT